MAGQRGPKPKPTALRILEGNPGRLPLNEHEPTCDMPAVKPSVVGMDEIASCEWDRLMHAMPPNLYTALDVAVLASYALAWSMQVKAQKSIDEYGVIFEEKELDADNNRLVVLGIKVNPAVRVWKAANQAIIVAADRLGLSPSVRARLNVPKRNGKPDAGAGGKFAGLIGQRPGPTE